VQVIPRAQAAPRPQLIAKVSRGAAACYAFRARGHVRRRLRSARIRGSDPDYPYRQAVRRRHPALRRFHRARHPRRHARLARSNGQRDTAVHQSRVPTGFVCVTPVPAS